MLAVLSLDVFKCVPREISGWLCKPQQVLERKLWGLWWLPWPPDGDTSWCPSVTWLPLPPVLLNSLRFPSDHRPLWGQTGNLWPESSRVRRINETIPSFPWLLVPAQLMGGVGQMIPESLQIRQVGLCVPCIPSAAWLHKEVHFLPKWVGVGQNAKAVF